MTSQSPSTSAPEPQLRPTFAELGAHPEIVHTLADQGIVTAFPIQEMTMPLALAGSDLIGQAKTGTGKTLGFGIPLLQRIDAPNEHPDRDWKGASPQALVVAPTRELAVQVASDLDKASKRLGIRVTTVYGGRSYEPQVKALADGVEVVVGTPGRLLDLHKQRYLRLDKIAVLVLDEADEMLDMGFLPDVERIVAALPSTRQTMLFSATMPSQIAALARRYMSNPTHVRASDPGDEAITVEAIEQHVWRAHPMDKVELISRILQAKNRELAIIFTETKRRAQRVADDLTERGFAAGAVHGDLGQSARERALRAFRAGKVDILVATDVAARGIDVANVSHVINYECPDDEKTYLHRIGRTGRAGHDGVAVTLVDWEDMSRWKMINKALQLAFYEPVETYSASPHVYEELGIPKEAKGKLPRSKRTRAGLEAEELEDIGDTGTRSSQGSRDRSGGSHSSGSGEGRSRNRRGSKGSGSKDSGSGRGRQRSAGSQDDNQDGGSLQSSDKPRRKRNRRRTRGGEPVEPQQAPVSSTPTEG